MKKRFLILSILLAAFLTSCTMGSIEREVDGYRVTIDNVKGELKLDKTRAQEEDKDAKKDKKDKKKEEGRKRLDPAITANIYVMFDNMPEEVIAIAAPEKEEDVFQVYLPKKIDDKFLLPAADYFAGKGVSFDKEETLIGKVSFYARNDHSESLANFVLGSGVCGANCQKVDYIYSSQAVKVTAKESKESDKGVVNRNINLELKEGWNPVLISQTTVDENGKSIVTESYTICQSEVERSAVVLIGGEQEVVEAEEVVEEVVEADGEVVEEVVEMVEIVEIQPAVSLQWNYKPIK